MPIATANLPAAAPAESLHQRQSRSVASKEDPLSTREEDDRHELSAGDDPDFALMLNAQATNRRPSDHVHSEKSGNGEGGAEQKPVAATGEKPVAGLQKSVAKEVKPVFVEPTISSTLPTTNNVDVATNGPLTQDLATSSPEPLSDVEVIQGSLPVGSDASPATQSDSGDDAAIAAAKTRDLASGHVSGIPDAYASSKSPPDQALRNTPTLPNTQQQESSPNGPDVKVAPSSLPVASDASSVPELPPEDRATVAVEAMATNSLSGDISNTHDSRADSKFDSVQASRNTSTSPNTQRESPTKGKVLPTSENRAPTDQKAPSGSNQQPEIPQPVRSQQVAADEGHRLDSRSNKASSGMTSLATASAGDTSHPESFRIADVADRLLVEGDESFNSNRKTRRLAQTHVTDRVTGRKQSTAQLVGINDQAAIDGMGKMSVEASPATRSTLRLTSPGMNLESLPEIQPKSDRNYGFRLDPPGMGRILVQIRDGHRGIEARLEAQSELAHQLITTHLDTLRAHLENVGVELGELSLGFHQGDQDADRQMPFQDRKDDLPEWPVGELPMTVRQRSASAWNGKLNVLA